MMKSGRLLFVLLCVGACFVVPKKTSAVSVLDLWMTGDFNEVTQRIENVGVHRTNTGFGLGGLSYDLQFSESLEVSREYSDYGWVANDGVFDISNPVDVNYMDNGSVPATFSSIRFDTVVDPPGSEFAAGTGIVELLISGELLDLTPRWIYFDFNLSTLSASDGLGQDLETTLGGSINIIADDNLSAPEQGHTLAVYVPEPTTLVLLAVGGIGLLKKRRA